MQRLATRLATWLATSIALLAIAPTAQAGSYTFSIGGNRFHVEAPRNCRSASCITVASRRSLRPTDDVGMARAAQPAPAPAVQAPQPACPTAVVKSPQAAVVVPAPAPPVLAAATSQPVAPPAPSLEISRLETMSHGPPRVDLERIDPPKTAALEPQRIEPPVIVPGAEINQTTAVAQISADESHAPLGEWESAGAKGTVRIERCGPALCGYALSEASGRGESVLVNMKPKKHNVWTGSIYSRSSGNTYYATMTLKSSGKLRVEACALGRFWCSGNDWTRVDGPREEITASSQPSRTRS
ncbi:DUF2147 domain-containing protein [Bradyrhizobium sp. IC3069]|uniref:DUF2147 domain-containing protein n=1 Tax=unclassified Bradyrhizobium TaxID=2631580 RepID=UPI001CD6B468|nr:MULTISPECIES: DUF2147 domain-containing protein [unclassified Bradyrhizobium]MCA1359028.1 DUF2147 domain-containing protein [Bradyrhizobium sp. IC4059]MCA1517599.1 DUF2147 domain-containing protein [Bradyrhizobium sp. IC3069]